jgi:hypothetical protein
MARAYGSQLVVFIFFEWNKFHPYNMNRAYGSDM